MLNQTSSRLLVPEASESRVILKHSLRGGLFAGDITIEPAFAGLISGSFVIETIFFPASESFSSPRLLTETTQW